MNITDLIGGKGLKGDSIVDEIGKAVGMDSKTVKSAAKVLVPLIMYGIYKNSKTDKGAGGLAKAFGEHKGDNVEDKSGYLNNLDLEDSKKMVDHVLSDRKDGVKESVSKQANIDSAQVEDILTRLTPVIVSMLAKKQGESASIEEVREITKSGVETVKNDDELKEIYPKARAYMKNEEKDPSLLDGLKDMLLGGLFK